MLRTRGNRARWVIMGAGALVCLALPFITGRLVTELLTTYLIFSLVALSLDLIWGYTGILSIGQFAFFGAGAYAAALVVRGLADMGTASYPLAFLAAVGIPGILGLVVALIFFSVNLDELFVLVTIALAIISEKIVINQTELLGGLNGLILPYWVVPMNKAALFYLVVGVVVLVYLLCRTVVESPFGKVLRAIKDSEKRTQYLGYNTRLYKVSVYGLAAAIAGLGGFLYAILSGFVAPPLLGFALSFDSVVWAAIGGLGTLYGPVAGTLLVSWAKFYLSGVLLEYWLLAVGFLFIVAVIYFPEGFAGVTRGLSVRLGLAKPTGADLRMD